MVLAAVAAAAGTFAVCGVRGLGLEGRAARWSGDAALLLLLLAWLLPVARWRRGHAETPAGFRTAHAWLGAVFLAAVVLHGARVQSGLTAALAAASVGAAAVGALPPDRLQAPPAWYARAWWMAHLVFGLGVSALAAVHVHAALSW